MPELPEVETVRTGLSRLVVAKRIAATKHDHDKSFPNAAADVDQFVIGAKIIKVARRAKVLLIELDSKYTLLVHLKMTGQLVFIGAQSSVPRHPSPVTDDGERGTNNAASAKRFGAGHPNDSLIGQLPDKSTRVTITFSDGSRLFFNDQRKFGWMKLIPTAEVPNIDFMKKLGPEPLAADFSAKIFRQRIRRRSRTNIKAALLDQSVIAGVGNIYADESLWGAKIHPATRVDNISDKQLNTLFDQLQMVLRLSIAKGGSTDRNYVDAEGKKGSYIKLARVFRRQGKPCQRCGSLITKTRVAGRGTHWCPKCQQVQ